MANQDANTLLRQAAGQGSAGSGRVTAEQPTEQQQEPGALPASVEDVAKLPPEQLRELLPALEQRSKDAADAYQSAVEVAAAAKYKAENEPAQGEQASEAPQQAAR